MMRYRQLFLNACIRLSIGIRCANRASLNLLMLLTFICKREMAEQVEVEKNWTFRLTKLLVTTRLESEKDFAGKKRKKSVLWERVLRKMKETDPALPFSRDDITRKFLNLMVTYRRIKKRNNKSGEGGTTWEFFEPLDAVYGTRVDIVVPEDMLESSICHDTEDDTEIQDVSPPKKTKRDLKEVVAEECEADRKCMNELLEIERQKLQAERDKIEELQKLRELLSNRK